MEPKFKKDQKVRILFNNFTNSEIMSRYGGKTFTIAKVGEGNKGLHTQYFLMKDDGKIIKSFGQTRREYPFIDVELELVQ